MQFVEQKLLGNFYRASFRKGVRVPVGVLGGGVWGRVQMRGGVVFLRGKGTGKSMRTHLSKLSFSKLPFSLSPNWGLATPETLVNSVFCCVRGEKPRNGPNSIPAGSRK